VRNDASNVWAELIGDGRSYNVSVYPRPVFASFRWLYTSSTVCDSDELLQCGDFTVLYDETNVKDIRINTVLGTVYKLLLHFYAEFEETNHAVIVVTLAE
jgi:hypothetical protein